MLETIQGIVEETFAEYMNLIYKLEQFWLQGMQVQYNLFLANQRFIKL